MDQQRCFGFGFQLGSSDFAHCMMTVTQQREAQQSADRRAADNRDAADRRAQNAERAERDRQDRDNWDRKTGQGAYSNQPSPSPFGRSPADSIGDAIDRERQKIENMD